MAIKYIFCINPGRSGSDYLTGLLGRAENTAAYHEAAPLMNGIPMQRFNEGDESALRALMPLKVKEIESKVRWGDKIYCETNLSYVMGWGTLLPDQYIPQEEIGVIILERDLERTARSLLRLHDVPGASLWSRTWYLTPGAARNLSQPRPGAGPLEVCRWYVREVRLRAEEYQRRFPKIAYLKCKLSQLNDPGFVMKLFEGFGLRASRNLAAAIGKRVNKRGEWPRVPIRSLLLPVRYPSADDLPPETRDELLSAMVAYIHKHRPKLVSRMEPESISAGSLANAAVQVVAHCEYALEKAFKVRLRFTDSERDLMWELLRSVDPHDIANAVLTRHGPPGITYTYDYNQPINMASMGRLGWKLGPRPVMRTLWRLLTGRIRRSRDLSHRADSGTPP